MGVQLKNVTYQDKELKICTNFFYNRFLLKPKNDLIKTITGIISRRPIHMFIINIDLAIDDIPILVIPVLKPTFP